MPWGVSWRDRPAPIGVTDGRGKDPALQFSRNALERLLLAHPCGTSLLDAEGGILRELLDDLFITGAVPVISGRWARTN